MIQWPNLSPYLDPFAGVFCGWLAAVVFTLHVVSSPKHRNWMNIPEYVRRGFLLTGAMFTWRSVNFFTVTGSPVMLGHINAEGMMALVALTYTVSALALWIVRRLLPDQAWDRLADAENQSSDGLVPVMVTPHEVVQINRALGTPSVEPGEGPEAVYREGRKFWRV